MMILMQLLSIKLMIKVSINTISCHLMDQEAIIKYWLRVVTKLR